MGAVVAAVLADAPAVAISRIVVGAVGVGGTSALGGGAFAVECCLLARKPPAATKANVTTSNSPPRPMSAAVFGFFGAVGCEDSEARPNVL